MIPLIKGEFESVSHQSLSHIQHSTEIALPFKSQVLITEDACLKSCLKSYLKRFKQTLPKQANSEMEISERYF